MSMKENNILFIDNHILTWYNERNRKFTSTFIFGVSAMSRYAANERRQRMKLTTVKRLICAALAAATLLAGAPAFAAEGSQTAAYWRNAPVVEGNTAYCWNEAGKQTFYLKYSEEIWAPLRTVAEWMGKDLVKDANAKSFSLSGSKTPLYRDQVQKDKGEQGIYDALSADAYLAKMKEAVPVTVLSGARLTVDGKAIAITGTNNKPASMISWDGDVYIPLSTAAKMMNMVVKHNKRTPVIDGVECPEIESLYIRTQLTDEQLTACKTYATTLKTVFDAYNENLNQDVSTMEAADQTINTLLGYMYTLKNTPKPDVRLLDKEYAAIQSAADEAIKVYKGIQQMIQNKEDLQRIQFAIEVDWEFKGYPKRQLGLRQQSAELMGANAMIHVLYLYNSVFEI